MAATVSDEALKNALKQRRKFIETNLDELTMKACRKFLEQDLGLPEKSLADRKELIRLYVDKIIAHKAAKQEKKQPEGRKQVSKAVPAAKKRKTAFMDDEDRRQTKAQPRTSQTIDKAKQICKAATIKIPPSVYAKTQTLQDIENNLSELLAKHELSLDSSSHDISKARDRLAKERDLEGIDVSNIVSGDRRARRSAAVAAPVNYAASDKSSSSDEASSSADEQDSSREESDVAASDDEGEAEGMEDDADQGGKVSGAAAAASSSADVTEKSQPPICNKEVHKSACQDNDQDSAMDMQHEKVKKQKAVIDDSDDDD